MKRNVLILEDVDTARELLARIVKSCGESIEVFSFSNVGDATVCMMENKIDLFLIDIILKPQNSNDFSGITFAEHIRGLERYLSVDIVFVTTLIGLEAQLLRKVHCFDYIEKPIREERVRHVVQQALHKMDNRAAEDAICFVRKDRVTYAVHEKEIVYLESHQRQLFIYRTEDVLKIPFLPMNQFLKQICTQHFLSPTKGVAVNFKYIEYVDPINRYVKIRGREDPIDIGHRMKTRFIEEFEELQGKRKWIGRGYT